MRNLFSRSLPQLDWIQVEVTSHCNASCVYCPYTVYKKFWQHRHLDLDTFKKILQFSSKTPMIHMQGWGEPFLNPQFFEMIDLAKQQGCRVGTTTNGTLADEERLSRIVDLDLDMIAFSLAGTDAFNDTIRKGTHLKQILESIDRLNTLKQRRNTTKPEIHIAFLLLHSGIDTVHRLPALLKNRGIHQVVISTLDFIASEALADESISVHSENFPDLKKRLGGVVQDGQENGIAVYYQIAGPKPLLGCSENISRSLFISSDGSVSPCVFTNLPLAGSQKLSDEIERAYIPLPLGNISEMPLNQIWWQKDAKALRRSFKKRRYLPSCVNCIKRCTVTGPSAHTDSIGDILDILD